MRSRSSALTAGEGLSSIELLVVLLHRAVAFPQVHDVARAVRDDLDLHVARVLQVLLQVDGAVGEGLFRLVRGDGQDVGQLAALSRTMRMPLPPPPAAAFTITG